MQERRYGTVITADGAGRIKKGNHKMALTSAAITFLQDRGIDPELADKYGVQSKPADGKKSAEILVFTYRKSGKDVNHKYRSLSGKQFYQDAEGEKCFWNFDAIIDQTTRQTLVITEGEMDALAAIEAGHVRVVSVPDGAPQKPLTTDPEGYSGAKYSYITDVLPLLKDEKQIIIASDADPAGENLLNDIAAIIGRGRCRWLKYPDGCKDLNDVLLAHGHDAVLDVIADSRPVAISGIYSLSELPPPRPTTSYDLGIKGLDDCLRIVSRDLIVMTGVPGSGKTTAARNIAMWLRKKHGLRTCMASFENHPSGDLKYSLSQSYMRRPWKDLTKEDRDEAAKWIDQSFIFLMPDDEDEVTLDWVLERAGAAVLQRDCGLLIIDPWNQIEQERAQNESETDYIRWALKQLKKFSRTYGVPVILVAHPAKMRRDADGKIPWPTLYDISGSAHWVNRCDLGIVVHRDTNGWAWRVAKARIQNKNSPAWNGTPAEVPMMLDHNENAGYRETLVANGYAEDYR